MICLITSKYGSTVQPFPRMATGNQLSKIKFVTWRVDCGCNFVLAIRTCMLHKLAYLVNVSPSKFWSLADLYPDLVSHLYIQVRLMGNLCLNGGIPWLFNTEGSLCFICKENTETVYHHFIECLPFRDNYSCLWFNLKTKIINFNQTDGIRMSDFITNLDPHKKVHKLRTAKLRELKAPWLTK